MASDYFGRASVGTYVSQERFANSDTGSNKNDYLNLSGRFYLRYYDIGSKQLEFVTDIRDKYDQYGALNRTKLQLEQTNRLQLRSLYFSNLNSQMDEIQFIAGRFYLLESGGTFTDGAGVQYKVNPNFSVGVFGGLNPMSEDTQTLTYNAHASNVGIYSSYKPKNIQNSSEFKNLFLTHAFVSQRYGNQNDRQYLYQNFYYQWNDNSRILSNVYLDFLPSVYLQNWNLSWDQQIKEAQQSHLQLLNVDTIQYRRQQGIRETLPSNPYRQVSEQWDFNRNQKFIISPSVTFGHRQIDKLTKTEGKLSFLLNDQDNNNFDYVTYLGHRKNFISHDTFGGIGVNYYYNKFDFAGDIELAREKYQTQTLNPIIMTLNGNYYSNRDYYYSTSFEYTKDENMKNFAVFLKLTYRFGSKDTTPPRAGNPRRGLL